MAKEFTAGEHTMRNGKKAVVLGIIPEAPYSPVYLVGYDTLDKENRLLKWNKNGKKWGDDEVSELDLMPNTKKIVRWGFLSVKEGHITFPVEEEIMGEAIKRKEEFEKQGHKCTEIFRYPEIEVEE